MPSRGRPQLALSAPALVALPLAAPGAALVPAAALTPPRWSLGIYLRGFGLGAKPYLGLFVVAFVGYLAVIATANQARPRLLWVAIAGLVGLFVLAPPLLSRDVSNYIAYERLGEDGLDPYVSVPADQSTDPVLAFVGWRHTPGAISRDRLLTASVLTLCAFELVNRIPLCSRPALEVFHRL